MTEWFKYPENKPPCDENKPKTCHRFLVCIGNYYVDTACLYDEERGDIWGLTNVTHFAELPSPPKGEE